MSVYYMPVKVFEEENVVANRADELAALGRKALIVTGRHSAMANGSYDDLARVLDAKGIKHVLFNEVEENPSVETIMKARDFGVAEGVDFVVGIGGGSPLDAAKAIALMIRKADKDVSYLYHPDGDSDALPIAAIPTTCGTGSEVTAVSVLTDTARGVKGSIPHILFPKIALVDGKYLASAPKSVLGNTAFDALTHLYESYINSKATPMSRMCTDAGLKTWAESLDVLRGQRKAESADRFNMMRASTLAGMAIAQAGTTLPHGLSYSVTTNLGVPHGKATAYFMAGYLTESPAADRDYLLKTSGFASLEDYRRVYHEVCGEIGAPGLNDALAYAAKDVGNNQKKLALVPYPADAAMLRRIAFYEVEHPLD